MFTWRTGLFALLLGTDEVLKQYVEEHMEPGEEKEITGSRLVIRKVYNRGFLLNTLDDHPEIVKTTSIISGLGVALSGILLAGKKGNRIKKLGMTFLAAGTASNCFDRLARGKVIDYIGVRTRHRFLSGITANLGDLWLLIGAILTSGRTRGSGQE